MLTESILIINKRGLHARAAAKFATTAAQFSARIQARTCGSWIEGKSVMSLMLLAATQGTHLEVSSDGE
ncbi:MAG: HPr family phosphocarrier protein, partial [Gammaproteobacteria bacterium]|nr:HPr family phosphocarrier protein [Gammaproteobacteria bacterium]